MFTTTALEPYLADEKLFAHSPTVLHLSLRDISVNVILASQNIVDDVEHCLKANTSLHLAEMAREAETSSPAPWWMFWTGSLSRTPARRASSLPSGWASSTLR